MRKMVCVRRCHGFRGGLWDEGEEVDVADGEDVPRHFIPAEEYADYKSGENSLRVKADPMKVSPQTSPVPKHLQGHGGMTTAPKVQKTASASKPGQDI